MKTEIWKDIAGYEGLYKISNTGKVLSLQTNKELKWLITWRGYARVALVKNKKVKYYTVHRIVLTTFSDEKDIKPTINHKDGNKLNNSIENLEWASSKENIRHAWDSGLNDWHKKRIVCLETGKTYDCIKDATKETNATETGISHCLRGRYRTSGGLHWELLRSGV